MKVSTIIIIINHSIKSSFKNFQVELANQFESI